MSGRNSNQASEASASRHLPKQAIHPFYTIGFPKPYRYSLKDIRREITKYCKDVEHANKWMKEHHPEDEHGADYEIVEDSIENILRLMGMTQVNCEYQGGTSYRVEFRYLRSNGQRIRMMKWFQVKSTKQL